MLRLRWVSMPEQPGFKVLSNLGLKQKAIRLEAERKKRRERARRRGKRGVAVITLNRLKELILHN